MGRPAADDVMVDPMNGAANDVAFKSGPAAAEPAAAAAKEAKRDAGNAIGRYPALDGLRGFALLLMLSMHFGFYPSFYSPAPRFVPTLYMAKIFAAGWISLDLFFVLSGFLITNILLASKGKPSYFQNFYGRRAVRIFPLYYAVLVVGLFIAPIVFGERWERFMGESWSKQMWLWAYSLNIAVTFGVISDAGMFGPLWSLAVEEQYYLFWPLIVRATSRRVLGGVCATLIAGSLAFRMAWIGVGLSWVGAYHFTLGRLDALAVGGGIALLMQDPVWRRRLDQWAGLGLALGVAALAAVFLSFPGFLPSEPFIVIFGHSMTAFTFGWLVVIAIRNPAPRWMCKPWLIALGTWSYSIYVWHWFIRQIMAVEYAKYPASSPLGGFVAAIAFLVVGLLLSTACGWVSHVVLERPFLRLKQLFRYKSSSNLQPASEPERIGVPATYWAGQQESSRTS